MLQKLNIADNYTGNHALCLVFSSSIKSIYLSFMPICLLFFYLGHALYVLILECSDKNVISLVWSDMVLLTDSWACYTVQLVPHCLTDPPVCQNVISDQMTANDLQQIVDV